MFQSSGSGRVTTWQAAERNAAAWMVRWGFRDARLSSGGADGGLDVIARGAVAQVKFEARLTGAPAVQRLVGAAAPYRGRAMLFFSRAGYSAPAIRYADSAGVALFRYDLDGWVSAANGAGRKVVAQNVRERELQVARYREVQERRRRREEEWRRREQERLRLRAAARERREIQVRESKARGEAVRLQRRAEQERRVEERRRRRGRRRDARVAFMMRWQDQLIAAPFRLGALALGFVFARSAVRNVLDLTDGDGVSKFGVWAPVTNVIWALALFVTVLAPSRWRIAPVPWIALAGFPAVAVLLRPGSTFLQVLLVAAASSVAVVPAGRVWVRWFRGRVPKKSKQMLIGTSGEEVTK